MVHLFFNYLPLRIQLIILAIFVFTSFNNALYAQPVKSYGQLKVEGTQLKDEQGNLVVLRGMSFGWHNWWPRFYTAGVVQWLHKDWGCTVIRAAMGVKPDGGYIKKPDWSKATIKSVVDAAIKEGIYVIIDWHSHDINLEEAKTFFIEIANTYGKEPHIIYEIFNEPDKESWPAVKEYSIEIVKAIRSIDPDNIILVGSPHWDQDIHLAADDPIKGFTNLMYTVHYYAATHKQWLRDRCDYALKKGLPIFISESAGMEATGDGPINTEEWGKWIQWCEQNKISWLTWSVTDKNETCSVLLPTANSNGNWREEDLKESGLRAREFLRKYNRKK